MDTTADDLAYEKMVELLDVGLKMQRLCLNLLNESEKEINRLALLLDQTYLERDAFRAEVEIMRLKIAGLEKKSVSPLPVDGTVWTTPEILNREG